jgi:hypothetical protein
MNKRQLEQEVRLELGRLQRTADAADKLRSSAGLNPPPWYAAAAAKYVADVFMGLENLWKRRCRYLGQPAPEGSTSHRDTLTQFLDNPEFGGRLPGQMEERLGNYLRFRHRFVHGYGYDLTWSMVEEPLALIPETVQELRTVWGNWLASLPEKAPREGEGTKAKG